MVFNRSFSKASPKMYRLYSRCYLTLTSLNYKHAEYGTLQNILKNTDNLAVGRTY